MKNLKNKLTIFFAVMLFAIPAAWAAGSTLRTLSAGSSVSAGDLFLTRQGADTSDKTVTGTQLRDFMAGAGSDKQLLFSSSGSLAGNAAFTVSADGGGAFVNTQALGANTSGDGLLLTNPTAATSGNQQYSPRLSLCGNGWKTASTAASQSTCIRTEAIPVQQATAPELEYRVSAAVNGGAANNIIRIYGNDPSGSIMIGQDAGKLITDPYYSNVVVGPRALQAMATPYQDVVIGSYALAGTTSGSTDTVVIGYTAGVGAGSFQYSTCVGSSSCGTAYTNAIGLGYQASPAANNTVQIGNTNVKDIKVGNYKLLGGTKFTTDSGCSETSTHGTGLAGDFTSGTTGTCTVVVTINGATGYTAPTGFTCWANDLTTPTDIIHQTASTTTTVTLSGTTVTSDVINFGCVAY